MFFFLVLCVLVFVLLLPRAVLTHVFYGTNTAIKFQRHVRLLFLHNPPSFLTCGGNCRPHAHLNSPVKPPAKGAAGKPTVGKNGKGGAGKGKGPASKSGKGTGGGVKNFSKTKATHSLPVPREHQTTLEQCIERYTRVSVCRFMCAALQPNTAGAIDAVLMQY